MPIQPLQLPDPIRPATVDWSQLGAIGDALAGALRKRRIGETISAATGPNGMLNIEGAAAQLAKAGLLDEARPLLALAQQKAHLAQSAAGQAETVRHNRAMEGIASSRTNAPQVMDVYGPGGERVTRMYDPHSRTFSDVPTQNLPAKPVAPPTETPPDVEGETKLRKEFEGVGKGYRDVRDAYSRVLSSKPDAAGDISLIFGYMRMLDPGSVVREGEFATAQNAAGIPDIVRNMYNRALEGTRLNPTQRDMFIGQAKALYDTASTTYNARARQYEDLAKRYKYDPTRILPDLGPEPSAPKLVPNPALGGTRSAPAPAAGKLPAGVTAQQALGEARAAIRSGKDPQAIADRLRSWGIDPGQL